MRDPQQPQTAEIAMVVEDAYQNQGLGKRLLKKLLHHARQNNITQFEGILNIENRHML